jgi:D-glycero-D-manno-heptose 1,7-bisphosphate phosphatase
VSRNRALFLDRDGVINHHLGYTFTVDNFVFIDGIFEFCHAALQAGYLLIVVTNQAGIGRGYFTEQDFLTLTEWMLGRFEEKGLKITDVFYCPYHPEFGVGKYKKDSFDRKPNPGMLLRAAEKHGLDLEHSIMIGDKDSDMQAASKAGVGVRWHYFSDENEQVISSAATHKIHSLQEAIPLLRESEAI